MIWMPTFLIIRAQGSTWPAMLTMATQPTALPGVVLKIPKPLNLIQTYSLNTTIRALDDFLLFEELHFTKPPGMAISCSKYLGTSRATIDDSLSHVPGHLGINFSTALKYVQILLTTLLLFIIYRGLSHDSKRLIRGQVARGWDLEGAPLLFVTQCRAVGVLKKERESIYGKNASVRAFKLASPGASYQSVTQASHTPAER